MKSEIKPEDVKLPEPAAWRVAASYWTNRDSIPSFLLPPANYPEPLFTADRVMAAVLEAKAQERERCAKLADAERDEHLPAAAQNNGRTSDFAFGSVNSAERIAAAIRAGHSITETPLGEG